MMVAVIGLLERAMPKLISMTHVKLTLLGAAVALVIFSSKLAALGLGAFEVQSNLDEPLNGVIELRLALGDDLDSITADIASEEEFANAGIDYSSYLSDIELSVESLGGSHGLRVSSNGVVIKEPFIHFLVRVDWSGGSFLREYTALIDPPVYAAETPKSLSQPQLVGTDQTYQVEDIDNAQSYDFESDVNSDSVDVAESQYDAPSESYSVPVENYSEPTVGEDARYGPVTSGESLSMIAQDLQQQFPDLSIYQIMRVLYDENQEAFIGGNINGLIKGVTLQIGDLNKIRQVDISEGRAFFREQLAAWDPSLLDSGSDDSIKVSQETYQYDDSFSSYDDSDSTLESASGSDIDNSSGTTDSFQVGSSDDTQSFVSASQGNSRDGEVIALQQQITELQTSLSSSTLENQELTERISILEGQLADMNRLMNLSVEDAEMASVEATLAQQNNDTGDIGEVESTTAGEFDSTEEQLLSELADASLAGDVASEDETALDSELLQNNAVDTQSANEDTLAGEQIIEQPEANLAEQSNVQSANTSNEVVTLSSNSSFMSDVKSAVIDSGLWKTLAGVGALLLGGFALVTYRRRQADEEFEISMLSIESQSQNSIPDSATASQSRKGGDKETSFLTVYSDSDAVVQADEVDPIAEADVYIAYGRDEQAEEVLLNGIDAHPDRVDIKHKILGLYHKNSNGSAFERVAEELFAQKEHLTVDIWDDVSQMGKDLLPSNPMFNISAAELIVANQQEEQSHVDDVKIDENVEIDLSEEEPAVPVALLDDGPDLSDLSDDDSPVQSSPQETVIDLADEISEISLDLDPANPSNVVVESISLSEDNVEVISVSDGENEQVGQSEELGLLEIEDEQLEEHSAQDENSSINLINFDEGLSELDQVEIDVLETNSEDQDDTDASLGSADLSAEDDIYKGSDQAETELMLDDDDDGNDFVQQVSDLEIDQDIDEAETQFELAKVFVELGDKNGAQKILTELLADDSNQQDWIAEAKELLASLEG